MGEVGEGRGGFTEIYDIYDKQEHPHPTPPVSFLEKKGGVRLSPLSVMTLLRDKRVIPLPAASNTNLIFTVSDGDFYISVLIE